MFTFSRVPINLFIGYRLRLESEPHLGNRNMRGGKSGLLIPELKKLQLQSEVISLERNCHDEELTGIICRIDDNITTMHLYTDDVDYGGFTAFETDQITEIYWGNREHQAISHLISEGKAVKKPKLESKRFQDIIIELGTKNKSVCFHMGSCEGKFDIGQIVKYDHEWLKIYTFGIKKSLSRMYKLILRESVSRIVIDSPYQNKIVGLHASGL